MLWGNETVSAIDGPFQRQVPNIRMIDILKTVVQAYDAGFLRIGTITPGNQSVAIATALATLRKQLAERKGDSQSDGIARKHR